MKVTVCQLHDERPIFAREWDQLTEHIRHERSELVLLPEMPFCRWFAGSGKFDAATWESAVRVHDEWEPRLKELAPAVVLGSRPVDFGNERYNEGFVWDVAHGARAVHAKTHLPDRDGGREGSWYSSATPDFVPLELDELIIGFLFGAELEETDEAQRYGEEGVQLLVSPRSASCAVPDGSLASARAACRRAGAYLASSSRIDEAGAFSGEGWILGPQGDVLARTSAQQPFVSIDIDPAAIHPAR